MQEKIAFAKHEGLGNDFIIVEDLGNELHIMPPTVVHLCDRRFGIGADGLILVRASLEADFKMEYHNSDGSTAEMCGNGLRCFAKYVYDHGLIEATRVTVETGAGIKEIDLVFDGDCAVGARVDMGYPALAASEIPVTLELGESNDVTLSVDGVAIKGTCVSMGNPHCVIFVDDVESAPVRALGPKIETNPIFPRKTNVEFAKVVSPNEIEIRVWERGAGETLACGTGACATAVAAHLNGYTGRHTRINLPGGRLDIEWKDDGRIFMKGPAREVFTGEMRVR
ncbi:MAG: diaminopimelate epimerase [Actinobacteria bacterium]|nr:diaminopimelate epimerase [Actinomycetota bacterium]